MSATSPASQLLPRAQNPGEAGRGEQLSAPSLMPREGGSPTAGWWWGGAGLLVMCQEKRAPWGHKASPRQASSTAGDGTADGRSQLLDVCAHQEIQTHQAHSLLHRTRVPQISCDPLWHSSDCCPSISSEMAPSEPAFPSWKC